MVSNKDDKNISVDPAKLDAFWQRIQLIKDGIKPEVLNREQIRPGLIERVKTNKELQDWIKKHEQDALNWILSCENKDHLAVVLARINHQNELDKTLAEPTTSNKEHNSPKSASSLANKNSIAPRKSPVIVTKSPFIPFKLPDRTKTSHIHKKIEAPQSAQKKSEVTKVEKRGVNDHRENHQKSKQNVTPAITLARRKAVTTRSAKRRATEEPKPFRLPVSIIVPKNSQQLRTPLEVDCANKEETVNMLNKRNAKYELEMSPKALLNVHDLMCDFKCSNLFKRDPPVPGMDQIGRPLNLHLIKAMIKAKRSNAPDNEPLKQFRTLGQYREMFHTMLSNVIMFLPNSDDNLNYVASCEFIRYADSIFDKVDPMTGTLTNFNTSTMEDNIPIGPSSAKRARCQSYRNVNYKQLNWSTNEESK